MTATATTYNPNYRYGLTESTLVPLTSGVAVNVGDICFVSGPTRTVTDGATTNTSTTVTSATALFTPGDVGAAITGSGIPGSTTIASVQSSTSITLSAAATATATGVSLTITPVNPSSLYPAMSYPWTTNIATTQANFVQQCVGVAGQSFDGSNTNAYGIQDGLLRVDSAGVYDFACASATFNSGDPVGVAKDTGNNLTGQTVVGVTALNQAIGRVIGNYPVATTVVRVRLFAANARLVTTSTI